MATGKNKISVNIKAHKEIERLMIQRGNEKCDLERKNCKNERGLKVKKCDQRCGGSLMIHESLMNKMNNNLFIL